jgi:hypothetical protein
VINLSKSKEHMRCQLLISPDDFDRNQGEIGTEGALVSTASYKGTVDIMKIVFRFMTSSISVIDEKAPKFGMDKPPLGGTVADSVNDRCN